MLGNFVKATISNRFGILAEAGYYLENQYISDLKFITKIVLIFNLMLI
jgi:hypothetical protein